MSALQESIGAGERAILPAMRQRSVSARNNRRETTGANYPYCPTCDGRIAEEDADSSRSYRIRGCTHCGVMLDEMGV
jgi:hypothetical protein